MPPPLIRGDYDPLGSIANMFERNAEDTKKTLRKVKRQMETLQGGDWVGQGAKAFYQEMDQDILPSLTRLASAFSLASRTTKRIIKILKDAEDAAARLFRLDGAGGAAGAGVGAGAGTGGGAAAPAWQRGNPLLARDPNGLFSDNYMRGLLGSQFQGAGSDRLRDVMNGLLDNPSDQEADALLIELADIRGRPIAEIRIEFERFKDVQQQQAETVANNAEVEKPDSLGGGLSSESFMGSNTQMRYGSVVGDAFGMDPAFGAMLNPTGGLVGPGNWAVPGDDTAVGYHGVVHDAAGYLHTYHGTGPGYDYLGTEGRDTTSPLSGQRDGIAYWRQATGGPSPISTPAEYVMRDFVGRVDRANAIIDGAKSFF